MKVLFLDRDGIINIDKGYIHKPEDVELVNGIKELLGTASSMGYRFIVVTNQAGVARGLYSDEDVHTLHSHMGELLSEMGFDILEFYHCPHHPEFTGECGCRKPEPGMLLSARDKYGIDMQESVMIGDKESDVMAGINAGVGRTILVASRYQDTLSTHADCNASDLHEAAGFLRRGTSEA